MLHIKDNYYIRIQEQGYTLCVKMFCEETNRYEIKDIGEYSSMKTAVDAVIKELIRKEINQKNNVPLHEIVGIMKKRYREFYTNVSRSHMNFV